MSAETSPRGEGRVLRSGRVLGDPVNQPDQTLEDNEYLGEQVPNGHRQTDEVPETGAGQLKVKTAVALLFLIFAVSLAALTAVYFSFPTLDK